MTEETITAVVIAVIAGMASMLFSLLIRVIYVKLVASPPFPRKVTAVISVIAGLAYYGMLVTQKYIEITGQLMLFSFIAVALGTMAIYFIKDENLR